MNLLPEYSLSTLDTVHCLDALTFLRGLPSNYVNCIVTSPPYWGLRNYGIAGQIGLEADMQTFIQRMVALFREARRVLRDDGVLWLNLGDSYAGSSNNKPHTGGHGVAGSQGKCLTNNTSIPTGLKPKDLCGIPWRVALALQADGWWLRSDIIWHKPNPMPESVTDRPTKAHEYIFLLTKSANYWYDADAIREPHGENHWGKNGGGATTKYSDDTNRGRLAVSLNSGKYTSDTPGNPAGRNKRTVWTVATQPLGNVDGVDHFAAYPEKLIEPCILAGCPEGGIVLDPFGGSGTTAIVAKRLRRHFILCDLNPEYVRMSQKRIEEVNPMLPGFATPSLCDKIDTDQPNYQLDLPLSQTEIDETV